MEVDISIDCENQNVCWPECQNVTLYVYTHRAIILLHINVLFLGTYE